MAKFTKLSAGPTAEGSKDITANGVYDISAVATANINVTPEAAITRSKVINENGNYIPPNNIPVAGGEYTARYEKGDDPDLIGFYNPAKAIITRIYGTFSGLPVGSYPIWESDTSSLYLKNDTDSAEWDDTTGPTRRFEYTQAGSDVVYVFSSYSQGAEVFPGWMAYSSEQAIHNVDPPTMVIPNPFDYTVSPSSLKEISTLFSDGVVVDGYNDITVNVKPRLQSIDITENGTYDPPMGIAEEGSSYVLKGDLSAIDLKKFEIAENFHSSTGSYVIGGCLLMGSTMVLAWHPRTSGTAEFLGLYLASGNTPALTYFVSEQSYGNVTYTPGWWMPSEGAALTPEMLLQLLVTIPSPYNNADYGTTCTIKDMSVFFEIESEYDGYGQITANVTISAPSIELIEGEGGLMLSVTDPNGDLTTDYEVYADGVWVGTVTKAASIDVSALGISSGAAITVKAKAISEASNSVEYTTS